MPDSLPFDEDFQNTLVAYLWRDEKALSKHCAFVEPGWFESALNVSLVGVLKDYYTEFQKPPSRAVIQEEVRRMYPSEKDDDQRKRVAMIERLDRLEKLSIGDVEYFDKRIQEFVRWCAMRTAISDTLDEFTKNVYNPDMPARFQQALLAGQGDFDEGTDWARTYEHRIFELEHAMERPRVPTGLQHLDPLIGGGLMAGELGILMAIPKGFKSGTMLNFGFNALFTASSPKNVLYVTLELSEDLVGLRFDIRCSGLPKYMLYENLDLVRKTIARRKQIRLADKVLFIKYFPPRACNCNTIREYMRQMWERKGIKFDLLIVDYLDLMKPERSRDKDYLEAVDTCEALRGLGDEENVPVWTAVRATREAVGRRTISMSHMSKAFERVGVADLVMGICQTPEERQANRLRLAFVAARNDSGAQQVECSVDYERMRLTSDGVSDIEYDDDRKPRGFGDEGGGGGGGKKKSEEQKKAEDLAGRLKNYKP